jgi:hypothetical protein
MPTICFQHNPSILCPHNNFQVSHIISNFIPHLNCQEYANHLFAGNQTIPEQAQVLKYLVYHEPRSGMIHHTNQNLEIKITNVMYYKVGILKAVPTL